MGLTMQYSRELTIFNEFNLFIEVHAKKRVESVEHAGCVRAFRLAAEDGVVGDLCATLAEAQQKGGGTTHHKCLPEYQQQHRRDHDQRADDEHVARAEPRRNNMQDGC